MKTMNTVASKTSRAWQRMLSGRRLDLLDPSPLDIEMEDIAHGLARVARWNGQTHGDHAFSVAQHCVLVEAIFSSATQKPPTPNEQLFALVHDAPEYVIGDMISPFKAVMGGDYKDVETRLESAVHLRFGLPALPSPALKKRIKQADNMAAYLEATQLAGFEVAEAEQFFVRPSVERAIDTDITPLSALDAQAAFLKRFAEIEALR
ncbi:MAG: HD family hydrolase [Pseudomonadota bacterium]